MPRPKQTSSALTDDPSIQATSIPAPPLYFNDKPLDLEHIVKVHPLPSVIRCANVPGSGKDVFKSNFDIKQPLLAYMTRVVRKVSAYSLQFDHQRHQFVPIGNGILIPEDYPGWFAVMGAPNTEINHQSVSYYSRLSLLATSKCSHFLIGGKDPIHGVLVQTDEKGRMRQTTCSLLPGTVLRKAGLYKEDIQATKDKQKKKKGKDVPQREFLKCFDEQDREMFIPMRQVGAFYIVAKDQTPVSPRVLQMKDILRYQRLPLIVKLIYGRVPTTPCAFTQVLLLTDHGVSRTLVASTLTCYRNINLEIPLGTGLKFTIARNTPELLSSQAYTRALETCKEQAPSYIKDIKVVFGKSQLEPDEVTRLTTKTNQKETSNHNSQPLPGCGLAVAEAKPSGHESPKPSPCTVSITSRLSSLSEMSSCPVMSDDTFVFADYSGSSQTKSTGKGDTAPVSLNPGHKMSPVTVYNPPQPRTISGTQSPGQHRPQPHAVIGTQSPGQHRPQPCTISGTQSPGQHRPHPPTISGTQSPGQHLPHPPTISGAQSPGQHRPHPPTISGTQSPRQHLLQPCTISGIQSPGQHLPQPRTISVTQSPGQHPPPGPCTQLYDNNFPIHHVNPHHKPENPGGQSTGNLPSGCSSSQPSSPVVVCPNQDPSNIYVTLWAGEKRISTMDIPSKVGRPVSPGKSPVDDVKRFHYVPMQSKTEGPATRPHPRPAGVHIKAVVSSSLEAPRIPPRMPRYHLETGSANDSDSFTSLSEDSGSLSDWTTDDECNYINITELKRVENPIPEYEADDEQQLTPYEDGCPSYLELDNEPDPISQYLQMRPDTQANVTMETSVYLEPLDVCYQKSRDTGDHKTDPGYSTTDKRPDSGVFEEEPGYSMVRELPDTSGREQQPNNGPQLPPRPPALPQLMSVGQAVLRSIPAPSKFAFAQLNKDMLVTELRRAGIQPHAEMALVGLEMADISNLLSKDDEFDDDLLALLPQVGHIDIKKIAVCLRGLKFRK